jgi:hypothetical protein
MRRGLLQFVVAPQFLFLQASAGTGLDLIQPVEQFFLVGFEFFLGDRARLQLHVEVSELLRDRFRLVGHFLARLVVDLAENPENTAHWKQEDVVDQ